MGELASDKLRQAVAGLDQIEDERNVAIGSSSALTVADLRVVADLIGPTSEIERKLQRLRELERKLGGTEATTAFLDSRRGIVPRVDGAFPVREIMVDEGAAYQPGWRLTVSGVDADFPSRAAAESFRKAFFEGVVGHPTAALGYCQDHQGGEIHPRRFLVVYADPDQGMAWFDDEASARAHFAQADVTWNCSLYGLLPRFTEVASMEVSVRTAEGSDMYERIVDAALVGEYYDMDRVSYDEAGTDIVQFLADIRSDYPEHVSSARAIAYRVLSVVDDDGVEWAMVPRSISSGVHGLGDVNAAVALTYAEIVDRVAVRKGAMF